MAFICHTCNKMLVSWVRPFLAIFRPKNFWAETFHTHDKGHRVLGPWTHLVWCHGLRGTTVKLSRNYGVQFSTAATDFCPASCFAAWQHPSMNCKMHMKASGWVQMGSFQATFLQSQLGPSDFTFFQSWRIFWWHLTGKWWKVKK